MKIFRLALLSCALLATLSACTAGRRAFDDGKEMIQAGHIEDGLAALDQALKENPRNAEFKSYAVRQREFYVQRLVSQGDAARSAQQYAQAEASYRRALKFDPGSERAADGLEAVTRDKRHDEQAAAAEALLKSGKIEQAQAQARSILLEDPQHALARRVIAAAEEKIAAQKLAEPSLNAAFKKPITLEFRDASLRAIFEVIARATQINFIFDRDVRPDLKSTIFVKNTTIEDVINLLLVTNQLDKRILNDSTVLIYPNTPAKAKDYQELVTRAFYLANADVKQTLNMIKTLIKTRDVFVDEKLNLLVMKDTPEAIRLAEKLIAAQDRAEPEVMLEVEVMEVKRSRLLDLGIQYPNTFTALNIANVDTGTVQNGTTVVTTQTQQQNIVTVDTLRNIRSSNVAISPNLQLNLKKEDGDVQILANPRIRVKNKEKAKIHIGEKVPVITTTSTANVGISESVNYLDVGLKLDVEPQVYLDNEVGIKVGLEVSSIVREIRSQSGSLTYQVGTRNAQTVLRLKDGETQVLAGLISDEDRKSASKIPGLGDLPLLGHLFSTHSDEATKTEIILLITPRIVRNIIRPDALMSEFASGTDASVGAPSLSLRMAQTNAPAPVFQGQGAAPPQNASPNASAPNTPMNVTMITPPNAAKGQEFNVLIQGSSTSDVKSLNFDLLYNPQQVEVSRVMEGAFMKQGNAATQFKADPVEGSGRLPVAVTRVTGGTRGAGALAVIVMRVISDESGPTQLTLENVIATDVAGRPVNTPAPTATAVMILP